MADTTLEQSTEKSPAWATILYPESCAENFTEILESSGYPCMLSPLHDQDTDEDGVIKKPHYHLLIWFKGSRRKSQAEKLRVQLKGVGLEKVPNPLGYSRYLCHLDDPDKALYKKEDVKCFNGLNYASILAKGIDKNEATLELISMAETCSTFVELTRRVVKELPEYVGILTNKSYFFIEFMKQKGKVEYYASKSIREKGEHLHAERWKPDIGNESPFSNSDGRQGERGIRGENIHQPEQGELVPDMQGNLDWKRDRGGV